MVLQLNFTSALGIHEQSEVRAQTARIRGDGPVRARQLEQILASKKNPNDLLSTYYVPGTKTKMVPALMVTGQER